MLLCMQSYYRNRKAASLFNQCHDLEKRAVNIEPGATIVGPIGSVSLGD